MKILKLLMGVTLILLTCLVTRQCHCMELTAEELAAIRASEEQDRIAAEREMEEFAEATKLSLQEQEKEKKAAEQKAALKMKATLPALTDEQMRAGLPLQQERLEKARYYSISKDLFYQLHKEGNVCDPAFLLRIFFGSMFQYYTHEFLGIDMTYNYQQLIDLTYPLLQYEKENLTGIASKIGLLFTQNDLKQMLCIIDTFFKAIDRFKQNELLQKLAAAYMRQKIVTEKLQMAVEKGKADLVSFLLKHDRYAIDLQTMIFHFMKEAYGQYTARATEAIKHNREIQPADFLTTFIPSFVHDPYYARIFEELENLSRPMPIVGQ